MTRLRYVMLIMLLAFAGQAVAKAPPVGSPAGGTTMPSLAPMVARVSPAVVNIATFTKVKTQSPLLNDPFFRRFFNLPQRQHQPTTHKRAVAAGSGVIVDAEKGYVLTNAHVIRGASDIKVTLKDGRTLDAKLVGQDKSVDLAVLQIDADNLTQVDIADSDNLRVGDYVVAIGNPFALGQTVTSGIVSALERSGLGIEGYENFIQTDASINPGNSGGALVNLKGQLVGIPTAIVAPSGGNVGIGFAIPSDMAVSVMNQLIKYGEVHRGMLGVTIQNLTPALAKAFGVDKDDGGVVITRVLDNSAADKAGLQAGDVVLAVGDEPMRSASELRNKIGLTPVGTTLTLTLLRHGKKQVVKATIGKLPSSGKGSAISPVLKGASLRTLHQGENHRVNAGVLVEGVKGGSAAERAGLRKGDIIISANHYAVKSLHDLAQAVGQNDDGLLLRINRHGGVFFLVIR